MTGMEIVISILLVLWFAGLIALPGVAIYKHFFTNKKEEELMEAEETVGSWKFEVYKKKTKGKVEYRWRLKAANGEIVAMASEGYTTKHNCMTSIELVKSYASNAEIIEIE